MAQLFNQHLYLPVTGQRTRTNRDPSSPAGCLGAYNVIGKASNIIRILVALCLLTNAVICLLYGFGFISQLTQLLLVMGIFAGIGSCTMFFDSAAMQWIVQKVLLRLTADIVEFEKGMETMHTNLAESQQQIKNLTLIKNQMSDLITSLIDAHKTGIDLNAMFKSHLDSFQKELARLEKLAVITEARVFNEMDVNHDGVVNHQEFLVFVQK